VHFFLLILALFLGLGTLVGLSALQRRFGHTSRRAALIEVLGRLLPSPFAWGFGVRGRFARSLAGAKVIMPSGQTLATPHLRIRLSSETARTLAPTGDLDLLAEDALKVYLRTCLARSWKVNVDVDISILIDDALRAGWIPAAQVLASRPRYGEYDAIATTDPVAVAPAPAPAPADVPTGVMDVAGSNFRTKVYTPDLLPTQVATAPVKSNRQLVQLRTGKAIQVATDGVLGRSLDCEYVVGEASVSRSHARVAPEGDLLSITDLGSSAGTFLNGTRLPAHATRLLRGGDELRLGYVEFRLLITEEARGEQ